MGRSGVDFVVKGRNVEVPDHFRAHVADKLQKIERYDHKLIEVNVELLHERNRRQSDHCQRVEITCVSRGPVIRAEACVGRLLQRARPGHRQARHPAAPGGRPSPGAPRPPRSGLRRRGDRGPGRHVVRPSRGPRLGRGLRPAGERRRAGRAPQRSRSTTTPTTTSRGGSCG